MVNDKKEVAYKTTKKKKCTVCKEYVRTNLELDNGTYICESCAQITGELAD